MKEEFFFPSRDGVHQIHGVRWMPDGKPEAVLQITHGMCEFVERYEPFAEYLNDHGFLVVGHDHLGHGKSVEDLSELGYFTKDRPAETLIEDMHQLREMTQEAYPDLPYFMLGHSMGSYLLRMYSSWHGRGLAGAVIMGTGYAGSGTTLFGLTVVNTLALVHGWKYRSAFVQDLSMGAGSYKRYSLDGTDPENSWLSKNVGSVKRYYSDPKCGFPFTLNGFLGLFQSVRFSCDQRNVNRIPAKLPVLFVSGQDDPVGDMGEGVKKSFGMFRDAGIEDISMKLYPGDRHEILNETDRDTVYADLLHWLRSHMRAGTGKDRNNTVFHETQREENAAMTKDELKKQVEALIAAPSCCPEAKEAGENYLKAYGTDGEADAAKALIAELQEDITPIDGLIGLVSSDQGKQIFGEERAAQMKDHAEEIRANGAKYCDCPACAASEVILDNRDVLLA